MVRDPTACGSRAAAGLRCDLPSADGERRAEPPCEKVVAYPPLSKSAGQRREFQEELLDADSYEELPGKWQAAILEAERNRPKLRIVNGG